MEALEKRNYASVPFARVEGAQDLTPRGPELPDAVRSATASPFLLAGSREGLAQLPVMLARATGVVLSSRHDAGPVPRGKPGEVLAAALAALGPAELKHDGMGVDGALRRVAQVLSEHGLDLTHPRAAAHLQPPALSVAVVADALASVGNASLDTYDSGPATIAIERWVISVLCRLAGLGLRADGVMTPGGSLSNLLGLLLARDAAALRRGVDARRAGIASLPSPRVFCSELSHFSVHRACAALGLGEDAVIPIATDEQRRMRTDLLARALGALTPNETKLAVVATAGTTDFGSVDPLEATADLAAKHGVWLHVDAAYGFGALFSSRLAPRLRGIERASSITLDMHKLGFQPAAASVLLVTDARAFAALDRQVDYLNPSDDIEAGLDGLLGRSLQTTRRPDAVKVAATLLAYGRRGLGDLIDRCHDLARHAQERIEAEPGLELVAPAELTTVVFRYRASRRVRTSPEREDALNGALRRQLLLQGLALIGRTVAAPRGPDSTPRVCLKLTLLNPTTTKAHLDDLLSEVLRAGRHVERELEERVA